MTTDSAKMTAIMCASHIISLRGAVVQWLARPLVTRSVGFRSLPRPGCYVSLLGVKTWLSTLEIVYLCGYRRRH